MADQRLANRTALVTGASRGIGAATAQALDRAGARVALVGRHVDTLKAVAANLTHDSLVIEADLGDVDAPAAVGEQALEALGQVDVLVNNAAAIARLPTTEITAEVIDELLATNVRAPLLLVRSLLPSMMQRQSGSIISVSSVSGLFGTPQRAAYAATKGAIDAATRSLAIELGPQGIRVNSVAPGVVDTAMWEKNKAIPGVIDAVNAQTPLQRWAQPDDIADVIVFLASDEARFVTGETVSAAGGMGRTFDLYSGPS